jgi:hypothetical protein
MSQVWWAEFIAGHDRQFRWDHMHVNAQEFELAGGSQELDDYQYKLNNYVGRFFNTLMT